MVKRIENWPWSSYLVMSGVAAAADWLETDWVVKQFGEKTSAARKAYRRFVEAGKDGAPKCHRQSARPDAQAVLRAVKMTFCVVSRPQFFLDTKLGQIVGSGKGARERSARQVA